MDEERYVHMERRQWVQWWSGEDKKGEFFFCFFFF